MTSIIFALCFLLLALPWQNYCNTSWTPISSANSTRLQPASGEVQKRLEVELYFFLYSSSVLSQQLLVSPYCLVKEISRSKFAPKLL